MLTEYRIFKKVDEDRRVVFAIPALELQDGM